MSDDMAYDITRLLFERQAELATIHPEARNLALATAVKGSPAPYHPGALRYYREKGVEPIDAPDEAPVRRLSGWPARVTTALAVGLSLYSLYWVLFVVQPQVYRVSFLLITLVLTFLLVPAVAAAGVAHHRRSTGRSSAATVIALRLAAARLRTVRLSRRRSRSDGRRARRGGSAARARSGAAQRRLDPAGHGRGVSRVRDGRAVVRSHRPAAARAPRLSARSADRHALHHARRASSACRSTSRPPTSSCSRSTARCSKRRGPGRSSSTGRWR